MLTLSDEADLIQLRTALKHLSQGDLDRRVPLLDGALANELGTLVNELADRMTADREALSENIRSLDETNRELRAARDQVIRSARLASAGTLGAGIAHEVGNPLGAILGFVDVARSRAEREGRDTEILDSIRGEAKRIDRIVRGLLDYARPVEHDDEPAEAGDVVRGVHQLLEGQGKLTEVDVSVVIESGDRESVFWPRRLEQVLVNLLLNAVQALEGRAEPIILVRVLVEEGLLTRMPERREEDPPEIDYMHRRRRSLDLKGAASVAGAERVLAIEVMDNGPGFAAEHLDSLFDPFFTTKDPGDGTGLGLSICARLVEGMGGTIDAENRSSGGARFVIRLPAMYPSESHDPERDAEAP